MKVKVTQKHIDEGCQGSASSCAIALALKDKGFEDVSVGGGCTVRKPGSKKLRVYPGNLKAVNFIRAFDGKDGYIKAKPQTLEFTGGVCRDIDGVERHIPNWVQGPND